MSRTWRVHARCISLNYRPVRTDNEVSVHIYLLGPFSLWVRGEMLLNSEGGTISVSGAGEEAEYPKQG